MDYLSLGERGLQWLSLAATVALTARLSLHGLHRVYRWFFAFLLFDTVRTVALLFLPPNKDPYAIVWMATEPVMWILYFLIVREVFNLVLRGHPGIATLGRYTLSSAIAIATVAAIVSIGPDIQGAGRLYPILNMVFVTGRAIMTTLVFFLLMITAFLVWFPIPLNRNSVYYCVGYATFFLGKSLAVLLRNVMPLDVSQWFSLGNLVLANLCLGIWIWKLNRAGELRQVTLSHSWRAEDAEALVAQLNSLNKMLLRGTER